MRICGPKIHEVTHREDRQISDDEVDLHVYVKRRKPYTILVGNLARKKKLEILCRLK